MKYEFDDKLQFSRGVREASDLASIQAMIPGCVSVKKTDLAQDRAGVDYIATLRRGAEIQIDGKARDRGCSRWWFDGPELSLEIWSVMPEGKFNCPVQRAKAGWTLSEASNVDMIYFSFDPADTVEVFLVAFQPLRIAFRTFMDQWIQRYKVAVQESRKNGSQWESKCVIVPATEVLSAIRFVSEGRGRDEEGRFLWDQP